MPVTGLRANQAALLFLAAALAGPVGIVLHELAHFVAAIALGLPGVELHFASISYRDSETFWQALAAGNKDAAVALHPLTYAGTVAIAGPVATALLSLVCAMVLVLSRPVPVIAAFCAAMALTAGLRSWVAIYYMFWVQPSFPDARPMFDEINASRALGIELEWIVWATIACTAVSWLLALPRLSPGWPAKLAIAVIAPVAGIAAWTQVGPHLLP